MKGKQMARWVNGGMDEWPHLAAREVYTLAMPQLQGGGSQRVRLTELFLTVGICTGPFCLKVIELHKTSASWAPLPIPHRCRQVRHLYSLFLPWLLAPFHLTFLFLSTR